MSRLGWVMLAILAATFAAGCSGNHHGATCPRSEQAMEPEALPDEATCPSSAPTRVRFASSLIFDRQPGPYTADQFAWRSDWPSTLGYYRAPEIIFYQQYLHDRQGPGWNSFDYTHRRSDTVWQGAAVR